MSNQSNKTVIGTDQAHCCFYLPTPPQLIESWHHLVEDAIAHLISQNGNHWRKIVTIMAKLMVNELDWRQYRDQQLLKQHESIAIAAQSLQSTSTRHIICGKESAELLQLDINEFEPLEVNSPTILKHRHDAIYLCPYLDYRQFPNKQINLLRQSLGKPAL